MAASRFLQLHFLTSYPASLLNRDDAGFAKRIPFGGATRTRISSQCLKRHWRTHQGERSLADVGDLSVRSRLSFERYVLEPLAAEMPRERVSRVVQRLMALVLGGNGKAKGSEGQDGSELSTGQITVLGKPELDHLREVARVVAAELPDQPTDKQVDEALKQKLDADQKKNLAALGKAAGIDAALFGRMVTSDYLARGDAAVHVAHAFTVHAEASESDYFSAVDDLVAGDSLGSGHIGSSELASGLYYGYVAVDVPLLVSNLAGCARKNWEKEREGRELAGRVVDWLVHVAATVSPGAKLGSTAPYAYSHLVLVEAGNAQPRTLANAFLAPVQERPDLVANTYRALARHIDELDRMYGRPGERFGAAIGPVELVEGRFDSMPGIADVAARAAAIVRGA